MIKVEIWSDFLCPFCYIGKRNFDLALEQYPQRDQVEVVYRSFELDPNAPKSQNTTASEYLAKKYGKSVDWAKQQNARVSDMAAQSGLKYQLEKMVPTNSFDAHRLAHLAKSHGKQIEMQEKLFAANFTEAKDLAKHDVLKAVAAEVGLDSAGVEKLLTSDLHTDDVRKEEREASELGISGVPFFVFNREFGVSGAQPVEAFLQAFAEATK